MKYKVFKCLSVLFMMVMFFGLAVNSEELIGNIIQIVMVIGGLLLSILFCSLTPKECWKDINGKEIFEDD